MHRTRIVSVALAFLLVCSSLTGSIGVVAAQEDTDEDSFFEDALDAVDQRAGGEDASRLDKLRAAIGLTVESLSGSASGQLNRLLGSGDTSESWTPTSERDDVIETLDTRSADITAYANDNIDGDWNLSDYDTYEVVLTSEDGGESSVYVVADHENGTYTAMDAVASTNRTIDKSCTLDEYPSRNANEELTTFIGEFVDTDTAVYEDASYWARMKTQYKDNITDCPLVAGDN